MWQRIQTLYLAIGFALIFSLFFCNFISYEDLTSSGESVSEVLRYRSMRGWLYPVLMVITTLIQLLVVFLYKSRMVQMWLVIFNALVLLGFQTVLIFDAVSFIRAAAQSGIELYRISYVTSVFPLVTGILNFLSLIQLSEPKRQAEISYAVFCLKKKKQKKKKKKITHVI